MPLALHNLGYHLLSRARSLAISSSSTLPPELKGSFLISPMHAYTLTKAIFVVTLKFCQPLLSFWGVQKQRHVSRVGESAGKNKRNKTEPLPSPRLTAQCRNSAADRFNLNDRKNIVQSSEYRYRHESSLSRKIFFTMSVCARITFSTSTLFPE